MEYISFKHNILKTQILTHVDQRLVSMALVSCVKKEKKKLIWKTSKPMIIIIPKREKELSQDEIAGRKYSRR